MVSGSDDKMIKIWTINNELRYRNNLTGHSGPINDLIFLNDGDLASCSSDHSIRVWDMNTNKVKSINNNRNFSLSLLQFLIISYY